MPSNQEKLQLLFSVLLTHPGEFFDRIRHIFEVKLDQIFHHPFDYPEVYDYNQAITLFLQELTQAKIEDIDDPGLNEIEEAVNRKMAELRQLAPFRISHSADTALARLCYLTCRYLKPEVSIETGVAFGVTSAYILKAMEINGCGVLHSIDLPPLGTQADDFVGALIPENLKDRWQLHRGSARHLLPEVLQQNGPIDLFIHDSLHTYSHMLWEFNTVTPYLRPGGVLLSDDIAENKAFHDWTSRRRLANSFVIRKINSNYLVGAAILPR
jgi:predicted O-methyltransferase YrrM